MTDKNKDIEIIDELDTNLMDHEYDGIMELDNSLPPWWLYLFYGTIIFAIFYSIRFFAFGGYNQIDEYTTEVTNADKDVAIFKENFGGSEINENSVVLSTDAQELLNGKEIFKKNCIPCHLENGGGLVGPNLTDEYWIHGNTIKDLFKTITFGVPEKGMIPWESQLKPQQIQNVASYILTEFKNKNVEGGKEPQGDKM
ncbi:MAG: cytochrome oxidase subunit III [Flavobacteriales bacterium CG_4_10_14_0_2_um_filter_32_8]|nr:MAG: cytochrome oxidase subunit III [Flavobacteriales bacterium CG_4_10_14_0_2_um_filter_32_8]PJB16004.1 MAG: cytochrome oxidase subunit III [Flavobacteriales bacterium CG_4_9_14_3_um_filter_32_8]